MPNPESSLGTHYYTLMLKANPGCENQIQLNQKWLICIAPGLLSTLHLAHIVHQGAFVQSPSPCLENRPVRSDEHGSGN